jgi:hypothetical protein
MSLRGLDISCFSLRILMLDNLDDRLMHYPKLILRKSMSQSPSPWMGERQGGGENSPSPYPPPTRGRGVYGSRIMKGNSGHDTSRACRAMVGASS